VDDEEHLILRGPALAAGYAVQRGEAWTWEPLDPQAGLRTRDRVQLWDHGTRKFLRFVGRESSFVKVLGELVNLDELQRKADTLKDDAATVVIWPEPDARKETQLILIGECSTDHLEILRERFNGEARGFERISAVRSVPEIPRTTLGKIDRPALGRLLETPPP
jgi:O-succinylbenzoic acid--CoA ligase